jgi:hypothetical protein
VEDLSRFAHYPEMAMQSTGPVVYAVWPLSRYSPWFFTSINAALDI